MPDPSTEEPVDSLARQQIHDANGTSTGRSLAKFLGGLTAARTFIVDAIVVASVVVVLLVMLFQIFDESIIIEEIELPESITDMGFSGQVAALRLWDALQSINEQTIEETDLDKRASLLTEWQQLEITEPETGLSLRALSHMFRKLIGIDQSRIDGEVVCGDLNCTPESYQLRLRVFHKGNVYRIRTAPIGNVESESDIDAYFHDAALRILEIIEPIMAAEFLNGKDNDKAEAVAERVLRGKTPHAARLLTLLGQINHNQEDWDRAEHWFQELTDDSRAGKYNIDPSAENRIFTGISYAMWGDMLRQEATYFPEDEASEYLAGAQEKYDLSMRVFEDWALNHGRNNKQLLLWWGVALTGKASDPSASEEARRQANEEARSLFEHLVTTDSLDPTPYYHLAVSYTLSGNADAASDNFETALALSTDKSRIYTNWAAWLHTIFRDRSASDKLSMAIEFNPNYAYAYFWQAYILVDQENFGEAAEKIAIFSEKSDGISLDRAWVSVLLQRASAQGQDICDGNILSDLRNFYRDSDTQGILKKVESSWPACH